MQYVLETIDKLCVSRNERPKSVASQQLEVDERVLQRSRDHHNQWTVIVENLLRRVTGCGQRRETLQPGNSARYSVFKLFGYIIGATFASVNIGRKRE
mgnify:CR=1 FL=1|jgi:hypothetical protein